MIDFLIEIKRWFFIIGSCILTFFKIINVYKKREFVRVAQGHRMESIIKLHPFTINYIYYSLTIV
jgi:hypothetical protein